MGMQVPLGGHGVKEKHYACRAIKTSLSGLLVRVRKRVPGYASDNINK